MVEKSHDRAIIGIVIEAKVKRTVTHVVENISRLGAASTRQHWRPWSCIGT
jgi:hypothetical protein